MENSGSGATILETPLEALHRAAGAKMGAWLSCSLPDDFGDWRAEYGYARESVALIDKNYRAYFSFSGPDRARYLNAILTNNINDLRASQGNVSLLLNPQGHILAEIETHAEAERFLCVSYASIRERLAETLEKFIIMDDVTMVDETERYGTLAVEGPLAAEVAAEVTGLDLNSFEELETRAASAGGIACWITRRSPGGLASAEFLAARNDLETLWQRLQEEVGERGGGAMGYTALNALRLEEGVPWFGSDFGEKQIPHEAGLQDSHISYTKGCYTGQEIVERVRSRGQVNRRRVGLVFSGGEIPKAGELLTAEGKEAGFVTRAAFSPRLGKAIGMGYARKEANAPGSKLEWRGGTATVANFPEAAGDAGAASRDLTA